MISAQEAKRLTIEVNKQNEEQLQEQMVELEWHIKKTIEKGFFSKYITYNGRLNIRCIQILQNYGYKVKFIKRTETTETWLISWGDA